VVNLKAEVTVAGTVQKKKINKQTPGMLTMSNYGDRVEVVMKVPGYLKSCTVSGQLAGDTIVISDQACSEDPGTRIDGSGAVTSTQTVSLGVKVTSSGDRFNLVMQAAKK
jgi:hypothetical protein